MLHYTPSKITASRYSTNTEGRDFVVGDIHGCYTKFTDKLKEIEFDKSVDRMFSVGDLVDRGPRSLDCLAFIKDDWFHAVKGNHEDMMCLAVLERTPEFWGHWETNGGNWHRGHDSDEIEYYAKLAQKLPIVINVEVGKHTVGICHAQPPKSYDWNDIVEPLSETMMLWGRSRIRNKDAAIVKNIDWTFHGHTPLDHVTTLGNTTFLDTAACYGDDYPLTVIEFADKGVLKPRFIMSDIL